MTPIGIGIVGSGFMGRTHADAADRIEDVSPVAITGGSRAASVASDYDMKHEESYSDLLGREDVDAVVVTTPHWLHYEQSLQAIEAGKHVLVEKPMATTVADAAALKTAAEAAGVRLSVGFHQRFREANWRTKELVESGSIGKVHCIQTTALFDIAALRSDPGFGGAWQWWTDPRAIAHLMNSAPHNLDLCRWWLGADAVSAAAISGTFREENPNENTTMAILQFEGGAMVSFWSSSVATEPGFAGESFRFRLLGEEGVIDLDPYEKLVLGRGGEAEIVFQQPKIHHEDSDGAFQLPRMQAYCDQMQSFAQSVRGNSGNEGDANAGFAAVAATVAMLESAETNQFVKVPR